MRIFFSGTLSGFRASPRMLQSCRKPPQTAVSEGMRILGATCMFLLAACGSGSPNGSDGGSGDPNIDAWLAAHNAVRANAMPAPSPALPQLTWNDQAASTAQAWAANCTFMHNAGRGNFGENIAADSGSTYTPQKVVDMWSGESADYDYATNTCAAGKVCGHYTQLVWRGTTSVGCGYQKCTTNSPFGGAAAWEMWVCDYSPPGNVNGQAPY
jgi:hypothetical protein